MITFCNSYVALAACFVLVDNIFFISLFVQCRVFELEPSYSLELVQMCPWDKL